MMFLLARDRRMGKTDLHYIPDGAVIQLEDTLVSRNGNVVIVQAPNTKLSVNAPASVNMTTKVLEFFPSEAFFQRSLGGDIVETLKRLENVTLMEEMPDEVRRFARIYTALVGLHALDSLPESMRESVILTVARLSGERISDLISRRDEVRRKLEEDLRATLAKMNEEHASQALKLVLGE